MSSTSNDPLANDPKLPASLPPLESAAPPVSAQIENIAPPAPVAVSTLESTPTTVPLNASAPIVQESVAADVPAVGMSVTEDPMSGLSQQRREPSSVSHSTFAYRAKRPAPPKSQSRFYIIVSGLVLLLAIGIGGGLKIKSDIERNETQKAITSDIKAADAAFAAGDVALALDYGRKADARITGSKQELAKEVVEPAQERLKHFQTMKAELEALDGIFAKAQEDLVGVRGRLENKKTLFGTMTPDNRPVVNKVEELLAEVSKIELQRKRDKLAADLEKANTLYKEGKIEDAAAAAFEVGRQLQAKPPVNDSELEKRIGILKGRAEQLKKAKDLRLATKSDKYPEAKRNLQAMADAIDENNADLAPLRNRIAALRAELVLEEKRTRKLSPDDAAKLTAIGGILARMDSNIQVGKVDGDSLGFTYMGKPLRLGFHRDLLAQSCFLESQGYRFIIDLSQLERRTQRVLAHATVLGEEMKAAGVDAEDTWSVGEEAPLPSGRRTLQDGKEQIFIGGKLYSGKTADKSDVEKEAEEDFDKKAEALAAAVESDGEADPEVRRVVAVAVRFTYKEADWHDHLPGEFVRDVVAGDYIEKNMPGAELRLKKQLDDFRSAFKKISDPGVRFTGKSPLGDEAVEMQTFEEHSIWKLYDKAKDATTFAVKNPDNERGCLYILYDFPGKVDGFPGPDTAKTVRMTHQAIGVTATYDMKEKKLTYDEKIWNRAVGFEQPAWPENYRKAKGYGEVGWMLPPHVLLTDQSGAVKSIVTPKGRVDARDFSSIADTAERQKAMDKFLDELAQVLPTANYLHLYFRYFFEYILDSPITSKPTLLGSRAHCGDIHQTTYESLERRMGNRFVGDCDDLAEFFVNITKRQNKLSFVMALPAHAAGGWAEKKPDGSGYKMFVVDTGPPRMFEDKDLDKAIEAAFRAYDEDRTMRFDPKSLGFLFRFNGEPTRTPYYLSSRMYTDREYGEAMEKVQSYWHFHFYALGIQTMLDMVNKGDKVPENCTELAGLYGQIREVEDSIKWTREALKQFGPQDKLSRFSEEFRIAMMWREERENEKAYESLKTMAADLKELEKDKGTLNYLSFRIQAMNLLTGIKRPWEAWNVVSTDMVRFAQARFTKIEHAAGLTSIYKEMQDQIRAGKKPTETEAFEMQRLEKILNWFYKERLFEPEDDFNDYMRKYAFLGQFYAAKYGQQRLVTELLKDGPYPTPEKNRNHGAREGGEDEDWKWIRLSIMSYGIAMGDALDLDDPPEKWRRDEAVKLCEQMLKAAEPAKKFGSLSSSEFQLLSTRVFRAFLTKDWKDYEEVLKETQKRDWARLTSDIAETVGRSARFVTPQEFTTQYRLFCKYVKPRTAFFTVIYEAYRAEGLDHAVAACPVALELNPGDEDMKREAAFLKDLAAKKKARNADKKKGAGPPPVPTPEPVIKE